MRRMPKYVLSAAGILLAVLMLCSCSVFDVFSVDSLIRAPKLTGDHAAVQRAFEDVVGKDISLVNPLFGDFRSAYVLFDYNKDGLDEAFVFYAKKDAPDEVHMNVLEISGGSWYSVCDIVGNGSEVYKIEFVNLDKDGDYEFAVTWTFADSKRTKTLALYKLLPSVDDAEKNMLQIAVVQLTDFLVFDIDSDGQNEVFYTYATLSGDSVDYSAAVFRIDPQSYQTLPLSDVGISKNIEQILGYKTDIKEAVYTVYIDCLASDGRYFTELLSFDYAGSALLRPQDENGNYLSSSTYRFEPLMSEDHNGDYMIDIPVQTEYEGSYYEDEAAQSGGSIWVTSYMQLYENGLIRSAAYYRNSFCGFSIKVDDFMDRTYVVFNADSENTQFRLKDSETEDDLLFTVSFSPDAADDGDRFFIGVTPLGEQNGFSEAMIKDLIEEI